MPLKQPERFEPESQLLASCSPRTHKPAFTALLIASHVSNLGTPYLWVAQVFPSLTVTQKAAACDGCLFCNGRVLNISCASHILQHFRATIRKNFQKISRLPNFGQIFLQSPHALVSRPVPSTKGAKNQKSRRKFYLKVPKLRKFSHKIQAPPPPLWRTTSVAKHAGPRTTTANRDRSPTTPGTPSIRSSHQKAHKSWQQKNQPVHFTSSLLCHQLSVYQVLYRHTERPVAQNLHFIHVYSCSPSSFWLKYSFFAPSLQFL